MINEETLYKTITDHADVNGRFYLLEVAKALNVKVGDVEYGKALHNLEMKGLVGWETSERWKLL